VSAVFKIKNGTLVEGESLCRTCRWVHMQKGFRQSEEAIFCDYGVLRRVHFKVAECTEYISRTIPTRYEMEKMALLIHIEPARKHTGFVQGASAEIEEEEESVSVME
jgi:hypothetical protein